MADRRMLWKNVCRSRKVNSLNDRAALLWTWAIPWFDRDGFLEVEPDFVKEMIFPKKNISEKKTLRLILEVFKSKLWEPYNNNDGKIIAFDPKFRKFQTIQYDREGKSEFKDNCSKITLEQLLEYSNITLPKWSGVEVKLSKEKERKDCKGNKLCCGQFENVFLTTIEKEKVSTEEIEALSEWLEASGKKKKSHYATILTWRRKNNFSKPTLKTEIKKIFPKCPTCNKETTQTDIDKLGSCPSCYKPIQPKKITEIIKNIGRTIK